MLLVTDPKFKVETTAAERKPVLPVMGTIQDVPGGRSANLTFKVGLKGSGVAGTLPAIANLLQACGLAVSNAASIASWCNATTLSVVSQTTLTMSYWLDGKIRKLTGAMGNCKFSGKTNEVYYLDFEFKGVFVSELDAVCPAYVLELTEPDVLLNTGLHLLEYHGSSTGLATVTGNKDLRQAVAVNVLLGALIDNSGGQTQLGRVRAKLKRTGLPAGFTNGIRMSIYANALALRTASFVGVLNDATFSGTPLANKTYVVEIDATPVAPGPDTFKWTDDGGVTWTPAVPCTLAPSLLSSGVSVAFGAVTGHTLGDTWTMVVANVPTGAALASSAYVNPLNIKASDYEMIDFLFATPYVLAPATRYHAVLSGDYTAGAHIVDWAVKAAALTVSNSSHFDAAWSNFATAVDFVLDIMVATQAVLYMDGVDFDLGNVVALRKNISNQVEGWDRAMITGRAPTLSLEPEDETVANRNLLGYQRNATRLGVFFQVGTQTGGRWQFAFPFVQVKETGDVGDRDGAVTTPLALKVNNGLTRGTAGNDDYALRVF
jgi:hypothetical protein